MRPRAGSVQPRSGSPEPASLGWVPESKPSTSPSGAGSPPARSSRLQSSAGAGEGKRRSVVVLAPDEGLGGTGTAGSGGSSTSPPKGDGPHPGLTRLTSFMRRKSSFRGKMSSINELAAAMDSLDQRIMGSLEQLRQQNAAGLGHVRSLHRTKSGRLLPSRSPSSKDLIPAFSPRGLLGGAVEDTSLLQRLKFHADEQQGLHDGGMASARGRLEGDQPEATEGAGAAAEQQQQLEGSPGGLFAASADKKRHTIAVPGSDYGSPKWGATEGGRDTLGWVRSLVKFTEAQPFMEPGGKPDGVAILTAAAGEEGVGTAAPKPARREDVLLLQSWLQDMMVQTLAQVGSRTADAPDAASAATQTVSAVAEKAPGELADAALWMYGVAFEELQRQVATESKDRADLLSAMWEHCFNLVELRCSLTYEEVIGGIKQELQSARRHRQQLQSQVKVLEGQLADAQLYDRDKFLEMQANCRRMQQLLGTAEEETEQAQAEVEQLKRALQMETEARAAVEAELHATHHVKDELAQRVRELAEQAQQQAGTIASQEADIAQLGADLQHSRSQERQRSEEKARLEVEMKKVQRDFQAAEILGMSLKEQLAARNTELGQLRGEHGDLQQRHAATGAELEEAKSALHALGREHEVLQRTAANTKAELQRSVDKLEASLRDSHSQLAALQLEKTGVDNALKESTARENVFSAQLKQLTAAHEQQGAKLRQEAEARKNYEDELQALRAGLQVSQQKLEGMGLVFASSVVHHSAAQAWLATGPISMGRQVVAVINQQLTELVVKQHSLERDLAVAKEHWQAEEGVRIRLQEQLLDVKAQLSKVTKDKEALEAGVARLEQQRGTLDNEVTQMRKMVAEAESKSQASHKKSLEAAHEAKRLLPLEGKVAKLEEQVQGGKAEATRLQQEVGAHQATIRRLLDEKAAALEELSQRTQALDAASAEVRALTAAARERDQLQSSSTQLQAELQEALRQRSAQEAVLAESMQQLAVARQLLQELSTGPEREKLKASEAELQRLQQLVTSKSGEVVLLQQRLASTDQQLQFTERQLQALMSRSSSPTPGSTPMDSLGMVVEQLRRVLEVKEERIRQLERVHSSGAASTSQLRQLQADAASRDSEVSRLQKELEAVRKKLLAVQEERMKVATRNVIALATDAHLPPEMVKDVLNKYIHSHVHSELIWAKAKLGIVSNFARELRAKLRAEQEARARAETESMCVEAFYLHQAVLDQRAAAVVFDSTFAQVQQDLLATLQSVAELRQLVGPGREDLDRARDQLAAVSAGLAYWLDKFERRVEKAMQVDSPEQDAWRELVAHLPEARPTLERGPAPERPPLPAQAEVATTIVHIYAHRLEALLAGGQAYRPSETVFDALAAYFAEARGSSREAAASPAGPVAVLLAGARAHQHRPKQLLLALLAGLAPSASGKTQPEGAWGFLLHLLQCIARLHGASWQAFVKEWAEAEEGVGLPVQCMMDVLANVYNTDAPALLDCTRRSLVQLIRQGRRGPSLDTDAFLLVLVNEFADGRCPVDPLAAPRRLTDGSLANALNYHANAPALPSLSSTVSSVAVATGLAEAYGVPPLGGSTGASALQPEGWRQKSPMRKRIVNLTDSSGGGAGGGGLSLSPAGAAAASVAAGAGIRGGSPGGSPGGSRPTGAPRSPEVFAAMQSLAQANPGLPIGASSTLRRSAPTNPPKG